MRKEFLITSVLFIILISIYFFGNSIKKTGKDIVAMGNPTICALITDPNCCGNGVKEIGNSEECDLDDSQCPECYQKCAYPSDMIHTPCKCYDFRGSLSLCRYYDNCSGGTCNCMGPPDAICNSADCWGTTQSVCSDINMACHEAYSCHL